jgi:hypothetical protein
MLELYFKHPRVLRRLRGGGLGNEMDRIAAYLAKLGYARASAKIYLSRLGRFSDFVPCSAVIDDALIDRFFSDCHPTEAPRIHARTVIGLARKVAPERFSAPPVEADPHAPMLTTYLDHLRQVRGLEPKTCEGQLVVARRVPVHPTTLTVLRSYARHRDAVFPMSKDAAFFLSSRGNRLSSAGLYAAFDAVCKLAGLGSNKGLRPHDLRHRFAVTRLAVWHQEKADVQALLPLLATYLGHARYTDTAYYITGTADLMGIAAERAVVGGDAT